MVPLVARSAPGGFHALATYFSFADFCGAARRNARGIGAIADFYRSLSTNAEERSFERGRF
jgi:hypothetical protein